MPTNQQRAFDLSAEDFKILVKVGRAVRLAKGRPIFAAGDEPDTLWLIQKGRVHVTKASSGGAESLIAFYGPGQSFCVAASLIAGPFPCSARAATDCVLVAVPGSAFTELFDQLPVFAKRLLTEMALGSRRAVAIS